MLAGETVGAAGVAAAAAARARRGARRPRSGWCSRRSSPGSTRAAAAAHWDELGAGIGRGLEALSGVTLPYGGADPWPDITLRLGGALLVTARRACSPRGRARGSRGFPFLALAALLVLVATPITAIGDAALARARLRDRRADRLLPVARAAAAAAGHRGRGAGRDRARRRAAAEPRRPTATTRGSTTARSPRGSARRRRSRFDWEHDLRADHVAARGARDAADQDARSRSTGSSRTSRTSTASAGSMRGVPDAVRARARGRPRAELERRARSGRGTATVTVRGLSGAAVRGRRHDARRRRRRPRGDRPTFSPGTWQADRELKPGDSYRIRFHAPRPNALAARRPPRSGSRGQQSDALQIMLPLLKPRAAGPGGHARAAPVTSVKLELRPFDVDGPPLAVQRAPRHRPSPASRRCATRPTGAPGSSPSGSSAAPRTPYEFVRRVDAYLEHGLPLRRAPRARRARPGAARALPVRHQGRLLPALLGRDGAAAALRRRCPARVATGFSPGGFRSAPGRVGRPRPRRALVGRGVVRRHRLGHVRPDADRHAGALADRGDRRDPSAVRSRDAGRRRRHRPARHPQPGRRAPRARPADAAERQRRRQRRRRAERRGSTSAPASRCSR